MKAESKFWNQVAEQMNPGWAVEIPQGASLAGQHDFIYVVEANTGWLKAGGIPTPEVCRAWAQMQQTGRGIRESSTGLAAETLIAAKAAQGTEQESSALRDALSMALFAMTQTETFAQTHRQRDRFAGLTLHWIYIVYRLQRGVTYGRPAAMLLPSSGLAPTQRIDELLATVMAQDLDPTATSNVAKQIRRDGPILKDGY